MNDSLTRFLAIWGAVLSTVVFIWEIFKWRRDQVRLVVKAERDEFGADDCIRIVVQNRGGKQTTLSCVELDSWEGGFLGKFCRWKSRENVAAKYRDNPRLPMTLEVGFEWVGLVPMAAEDGRRDDSQEKRDAFKAGRMRVRVHHAHRDKPIRVRVKEAAWDM